MKAVLRDRAFVEVNALLKAHIEKELTYTIPIKVGAFEKRYVKLFDYRVVNDRTLSIPIGRIDLIPSTHDVVDKRIYNMVDFHLTEDLELRDAQQEVYDTIEDNCIINAGCGEGKTITALALVEKLGQKTIVILHTKKLMDQWVNEIRNILQIEPGIIGSGQYNIDADIVVAMKQTLDKKADAKLYSEFGLVISDECHHTPAKTFNAIIDKFRSRYKIGLTATLRRKDEKHFLITNYISEHIKKMESGHTMIPEVIAIRTDIRLPGDSTWQGRVSKLIENNDYISLLLSIVQDQAKKGHKVLCIASRVGLLEKLKSLTNNSELIIGGSSDTEEVIKNVYSGKTTTIYGSTQVMSEGISVNPLSCLLYGTPFSSDIVIEQTVGRVIREFEGKLNPMIFDIILKGQTGASQWRARKKYYDSKGYKITEIIL